MVGTLRVRSDWCEFPRPGFFKLTPKGMWEHFWLWYEFKETGKVQSGWLEFAWSGKTQWITSLSLATNYLVNAREWCIFTSCCVCMLLDVKKILWQYIYDIINLKLKSVTVFPVHAVSSPVYLRSYDLSHRKLQVTTFVIECSASICALAIEHQMLILLPHNTLA